VRVAVDTHALLWYLQGSSQISAPARLAIDGAIHIGGIVVSTGTLFDLTYLTEKGKLPYQAMRDVRDKLLTLSVLSASRRQTSWCLTILAIRE